MVGGRVKRSDGVPSIQACAAAPGGAAEPATGTPPGAGADQGAAGGAAMGAAVGAAVGAVKDTRTPRKSES